MEEKAGKQANEVNEKISECDNVTEKDLGGRVSFRLSGQGGSCLRFWNNKKVRMTGAARAMAW